MLRRVALALALSAPIASCGAPRAPAVTTIAPASATPSASAAPPPATDLSPVAAPAGLLATVRFAHPLSSLDRARAFLDAISPSGGGGIDLEELVNDLADADVGPSLDLDAPVDVAVFGPGPNVDSIGAVVVSAALRPGADVTAILAEGAPDDDDADAGDAPADRKERNERCVVAAAFGPAARRLVCAFGSSSVEALAPFMARTLTRAPATTSDVHAELRISHDLDKLEDLAESAAPKDDVDPITEKAVKDLYAHYIDDLQSLAFDVGLDAQALALTVSLRFATKQSQLTRLTLSGNDAAGPPPATFFRLPADSSIALFSRGTEPKDMAPLREAFFHAMRKGLEDDGAPKKVIEAVMGALDSTVMTGGPLVVAAGHDTAAARGALASYVAHGKDTIPARSAARTALQGWWLVGVEEPSAKWIDAWKKMVAADAVKYESKKKPKKDPSKSDKETSRLALAPLPAGSPLPKDTLHVEIRSTPKKGVKDPPLAHVAHLFIVPDGARTWLAMGEDVKLVTDHVRASMSGAPSAGTLDGRAGIDRLRTATMTSGGFATFAGIVAAFVDDTTDKELKAARESLDSLAQLKARGETPMVLLASPDRAAPAGGGGKSYELRLPTSALADIAQHLAHKP